jgi:hypothetical protein
MAHGKIAAFCPLSSQRPHRFNPETGWASQSARRRSDVDRRSYRTLQDAVPEAKTMPQGIVRIGLAGVPVEGPTLSPPIFIVVSGSRGSNSRTRTIHGTVPSEPKTGGDSCAIATYNGCWEHPDEQFARAVRASASANWVQNFAIPEDALAPAPASGARPEISNRWQEPTTTVKKAPHVGSSAVPNLDQPTACRH